MKQYVFTFEQGNANMRQLLGGKGANLAEMTGLGLPVPPGFTISTEACNSYYENDKTLDEEITAQAMAALEGLEKKTGKGFGDAKNPLLVSVRSGAAVSMPGMMDTVLNLGLTDETARGMAEATQNPRFAYDSYRRFIQMFANVVMELDMTPFEAALEAAKQAQGVKLDRDLSAESLMELVKTYQGLYEKATGKPFPQDPKEQLVRAIEAVFRSWNTPRANYYRQLNDIPSTLGTAVNVQSMVFGNMGDDCGTGVAFTRSPSTGENKFYGEYLMNAQGEDVVAGIRTPQHIDQLKNDMPEAYETLIGIAQKLESHFHDMQDIEFTIERGKLYMLQTRNGKRTMQAALQIAVDMVEEGKIGRDDALLMIDAKQINTILHPTFDENALKQAAPVAVGLPASPGAATGQVYFSAEEVEKAAADGQACILVRTETSPEDIQGMNKAKGILTARGGMTSHAAVVCRGMGRCCVAGCNDIFVDEEEGFFRTEEGRIFKRGDWISLDGNTGRVYGEQLPTVPAKISGNFETIMQWADDYRTMGVRTNADTPRDAQAARDFGAEGIGLCRTEHMFFDAERIASMRRMILADNERQRKAALEELLPMQKQDFKALYKVMGGRPVTIRLLDPPLHEFIPKEEEEIRALAESMGVTFEELNDKAISLHETNPMLGHRGCRLAVTYPEIARMQTTAIMEAAIEVCEEERVMIQPEIMIPLVGEVKELAFVKKIVKDTAESVINRMVHRIPYLIGTMMEIPRACLTADEIAKEAEFFSFGTNDLSQMTFGFSRDDAGKFLPDYFEFKIFEQDPFASVDVKGVGKLMQMAVQMGREQRPNIKLGICGEQGGDPKSVEFCHNIGLTYVSCSPFRVPIARLAAAQAAIRQKRF
ncbi:MAG: pyruvate, phosphate dikinase [Clostridiales bacterium]|nr:pyruvate, phosphate dikinase [Clostridiales bacterium]